LVFVALSDAWVFRSNKTKMNYHDSTQKLTMSMLEPKARAAENVFKVNNQ
jgi:hypothetical protein